MPEHHDEDDIGPYLGILTVINPKTLDSQVFIIEDIDVASLSLKIQDLGTKISTVRNTILQKARKVNMREVWRNAKTGAKIPKPAAAGFPLSAHLLLLAAGIITSASLTLALVMTKRAPAASPPSAKQEKDKPKKQQPDKPLILKKR